MRYSSIGSIWLAALAPVLVGAQAPIDSVAEVRCESPLSQAPRSRTLESIVTVLLSSDAIRSCLPDPKANRRTPDSTHVQQVGSVRGVKFMIAEWGFGMVWGDSTDVHLEERHWRVVCQIDQMDDSRLCVISRGGLMIGLIEGGYRIELRGQHYPGSEVILRVDDGEPFRTSDGFGFFGSDAKRVVAALRSGKRVLMRYHEWPSRRAVTGDQSLYGLDEALEITERAFASLRKGRTVPPTN